ncbi:MAG: HU family DNA-binding protein [Candidatus Improbicoccus devescovinae]|nr:MAG: HU family DNA-binding protein [Candidatus Improbicoccus devescovinae]
MNKSEIITEISSKTGEDKKKVENFIEAFMGTVINALSQSDKVQLLGFGTFLIRHREARIGRSPRDGANIQIPASNSPVFKPGKSFKDAVNS